MTDRDDEAPPGTGAPEGYDILAERAGEDLPRAESPWVDSFFQEHYSWPAARAMLPDVSGLRVLIAGCGRGDHVGWFLDRGATVVGVDASEAAIRAARQRFGDGAAFRRADLTDPLGFGDGRFDLVFSHLVMSHVEEWEPVFREFRSVLEAAGSAVLATVHPAYLRREKDVTNYYATQRLEVSWPGARIPTYYRPMSAVIEPLVAADFRLEAFEEPEPRETYAEVAPERYESARESPAVLCIRAGALP